MIGVAIKVGAADVEKAQRQLESLEKALSVQEVEKIVDRVAFASMRQVIEATPKKWFGQARKGWTVKRPEAGVRVLENPNPVFRFIDQGTQAHGPKKAKALFIPITKRAALAYAAALGFNPEDSNWTSGEGGRRLFVSSTTRTGKGKLTELEWGKDYVLAKRVRGITARRISEGQRKRTNLLLRETVSLYVRRILKL